MSQGNVFKLVINRAERSLGRIFPGYFADAKHNHYNDFGFPVSLTFEQFYGMYARNGVAKAAVIKTISKTWQDVPFLLEKERDGSQQGEVKETTIERQVRERFEQLRMWQRLAEADRRGLVGHYAAVILRFADNQTFDQPVTRVPGGLEGLVEVIPAWEGQLSVGRWDDDQRSETYGQPVMYQFNESAVLNEDGGRNAQRRQFNVHPDRVVIWSQDGTMHGESMLQAGYNDLMTMEKVIGAGGEGFWKNAKSSPVFEVDKEASIANMAKSMQISIDELVDKMNAQVEDWQKGFDRMLMVQGMKANPMAVQLPQPQEFFDIALQSFAASIEMPTKILVGMQTGERASSEDAQEWAKTNMARRTNTVIPNTMTLVERLKKVGILQEKPWFVDWTDLTETAMSEKIDRAFKMTEMNAKSPGEYLFTPEEIRAAVDLEPLSDADSLKEEEPEDEGAAATPPGNEDDPPKDPADD